MTLLKATAIGLGLLVLSGCAVYEPYPAYPSYPAYPEYSPPVVVQPQIYGWWGGGWWGGPRYGYRGHGGHGGYWGHRGYGHWR
ncbi:hypothetical protein [Azospirillum sp.]|uniref:hypothetical protein n=1 Tax=Azospirillum sp. TaxID=34012 RepID=UPI003D73C449